MKTCLLTLFIIGNFQLCFAQNYLQSIDATGINFGLEATSNGLNNTYGLLSSFTIKGRTDLGFSIGHQVIKRYSIHSGYFRIDDANSYNFSLGFLLLKQGVSKAPISLSFRTAYQFSKLTESKEVVQSVKPSLGLYYQSIITKNLSFILGYTLALHKQYVEVGSSQQYLPTNISFDSNISVTTLIHNIRITPSFSIADERARWSIVLGFVQSFTRPVSSNTLDIQS